MGVVNNAAVRVESNASPQPDEQMTTLNNIRFNASYSPWSQEGANAAQVKPWGIESGGVVAPAVSGGNDQIDIAQTVLIMPGSNAADGAGKVSVNAATDFSVTRPTGQDFVINSITVDTSGAFVEVAGTASTSFSDTRGTAGGPPFIPVDSVEIAQVKLNSQASAAIASTEIFQVPGMSQELTGQPVLTRVSSLEGYAEFSEALPNIHTGGVPKQVWLSGALAVDAEVKHSRNLVPPDTAYTSNSEQFYDAALASVTKDIQQGSFEVALDDGVADWLLAREGLNLVVRFYPDKAKGNHILMQGILGVTRQFPVDGQILGTFTINATEPPINVVA